MTMQLPSSHSCSTKPLAFSGWRMSWPQPQGRGVKVSCPGGGLASALSAAAANWDTCGVAGCVHCAHPSLQSLPTPSPAFTNISIQTVQAPEPRTLYAPTYHGFIPAGGAEQAGQRRPQLFIREAAAA